MDTAKVRIQTQPPPQSSEAGGKKLYSSTLHCIRNIVNKEGASTKLTALITEVLATYSAEISPMFWA